MTWPICTTYQCPEPVMVGVPSGLLLAPTILAHPSGLCRICYDELKQHLRDDLGGFHP